MGTARLKIDRTELATRRGVDRWEAPAIGRRYGGDVSPARPGSARRRWARRDDGEFAVNRILLALRHALTVLRSR